MAEVKISKQKSRLDLLAERNMLKCRPADTWREGKTSTTGTVHEKGMNSYSGIYIYTLGGIIGKKDKDK